MEALSNNNIDSFNLSDIKSEIHDCTDKIALMERLNALSDEEWQLVLEEAGRDNSLLAFLALWPRFWSQSHQKSFYKFLEESRPKRLAGQIPFPLMKRKDSEFPIILPNMIVQQMTYGCSQSCAFCDVAAPHPRVDGKDSLEHIPYKQIKVLGDMYQMFRTGLTTGVMPYWASDPFDHPDIGGIIRVIKDKFKQTPSLVSHAPEASVDKMIDILKRGEIGLRLSITGRNIERVRKVLSRVIGEEFLEDNGIPTHLPMDNSDDFLVHIRPQRQVRIDRQPKTKTLGVSMKKREHPEDKAAYGCQSGVMMTPLGLYSKINYVSPTDHHPFGDIIVPLEALEQLGPNSKYIGQPIEALLAHTVPRATYDRSNSLLQTDKQAYFVVDADYITWKVDAKKRGKAWIVTKIS